MLFYPFIASALIKPNKNAGQKAFALSMNRDDIINGAADLEEHISFCIEAVKGIAGELGLAGECG